MLQRVAKFNERIILLTIALFAVTKCGQTGLRFACDSGVYEQAPVDLFLRGSCEFFECCLDDFDMPFYRNNEGTGTYIQEWVHKMRCQQRASLPNGIPWQSSVPVAPRIIVLQSLERRKSARYG